MKAADLAVLAFALVLAGGVFGAFYVWKTQQAKAERERYEAGIDSIVDSKIAVLGLAFLTPELAVSDDASAALRALYADPRRSDRLNLAFGTLQGDFRAAYAEHAVQAGREPEPDRLQRELDELWGQGAFAFMMAQYETFLADVPHRQAQENDSLLQQCLAHARTTEQRGECRDGYARAQAAVGLTP